MHTRNHSSQRSIKSRKLLCRDFARICARIHRHPLQPRIVPRNGSNPVNYPNVHRTLENSWRIRCWTLGEILSLSFSLFLSFSFSISVRPSFLHPGRTIEGRVNGSALLRWSCSRKGYGANTMRACGEKAKRKKERQEKRKRKKISDWRGGGFRRNYGEAPVKITTGHCSWKLHFFFRVARNGFLTVLLSDFAVNTRRQVIDASPSELIDATTRRDIVLTKGRKELHWIYWDCTGSTVGILFPLVQKFIARSYR